MSATISIRLANPDRDADAVAAIYRSSVERSIASFEEEPPSAAAMANRMRSTLERWPWLVSEAEPGGAVIGYAYAGQHRERAAYRWSVDISVYVQAGLHGRGIGRSLYRTLLELLRRQGFVNVYAGITLPNPASEALHRAMGMELVGVYTRVGFKFGAWHDVAWYQLRIAEPIGTPPEPIPLADLARDGILALG